jgi:hypothetical protein
VPGRSGKVRVFYATTRGAPDIEETKKNIAWVMKNQA